MVLALQKLLLFGDGAHSLAQITALESSIHLIQKKFRIMVPKDDEGAKVIRHVRNEFGKHFENHV